MRFWEENRLFLAVLGAFCALYALLSLFVIGPNATLESQTRQRRDKAMKKVREELFTAGFPLTELEQRYQESNTHLSKQWKVLDENLSRPFPAKLIPEENLERRQAYVRETLGKLEEEISKLAGDRKVDWPAGAGKAPLGLVIPPIYDESLEKDISYLQQMINAKEFAELLLRQSEEADGRRNLLRVQKLKPSEETLAGPLPAFIREYAVDVEMIVSLRGLMRILHACSDPKPTFILKKLAVSAVPESRRTLIQEEPMSALAQGERVVMRKPEHYYKVAAVFARMEVFEPQATTAPEEPKSEGWRITTWH
ncbi:MAG: hypothetical protein V1918_00870 [Planctomycetota bacterium]